MQEEGWCRLLLSILGGDNGREEKNGTVVCDWQRIEEEGGGEEETKAARRSLLE